MRRVNEKSDVDSNDWLEQPQANADWPVSKRTRCNAKA